jgi:hypothetical protein
MRPRASLLVVALSISAASAIVARAEPAPPGTVSHRELNTFPVVGGDSDVGVGAGLISDLARIEPGLEEPYRWRIENGAFITFKLQDGQLVVPFQDYYFLITLRDLGTARRISLDIRPAFTDERTLKYYGIGNASRLPPSTVDIRDTEYRRIHPTLLVEARARVTRSFYVMVGNVYTQNWLTVGPSTLLARDQQSGTPEVKSLLGSFASHGVDLIEAAIQYDTRDGDVVTRNGMYHALEARLSPAIPQWGLPYRYLQLDATAQFYVTPIPRWLTLSWRAVGDAQLGSPPFYEMARFEETPAIGGGKAIRGVPAQRYYGKVKLFGNFEMRSELLPFKVKTKSLILGVALFADAGRTWTELTHANPDLDGTGLGLKYGLGGGLRLQEGQSFVVRADVAWSPDASPVGAYFAAGEIF